MLDWNKLINYREEIHERYPTIWDLKLIKRPSWLVKRNLRPSMRILDVGARDRRMHRWATSVYRTIVYKSIDIDLSAPHNYHSFADIDEQCDLIILFEVIEHLELEEGIALLGRLQQLLAGGGTLLISTPNIYNPALHAVRKEAYTYEELGGLVLSQGFTVREMYRIYHISRLKYYMLFLLLYPVHRILNADFAQAIVCLAQKEERI